MTDAEWNESRGMENEEKEIRENKSGILAQEYEQIWKEIEEQYGYGDA